MTEVATLEKPKGGLIVRFGERYGLEPARVLETLKATAFKTDKPISNEQMMALMIVAERHALDPFTREIFAFPDKNGGIVPVVSVDGWARIVNEHPMMDGLKFGWDHTEGAMTCTMWRKDRSHPIEVTEYRSECDRGTPPWRSHPRRMMRHKALIQCARLAFGFAGIYDEDEARRIIAGDMPNVESPSTGAQRVREILAPNPSLAGAPGPFAEYIEEIGPDISPMTMADLMAALSNAPDFNSAVIVMDEARSAALTPSELAELTQVWHAKWQPTEEKE